ncbi:MAG TPA: carbamoyl phosphate synthase small subunit [Alphaproteobacteria bacterium]|mgnify:CR=1 FL=1|nr:carbamoyl phosphate synthase small subunit [Alphaproteobacteria bacterium]
MTAKSKEKNAVLLLQDGTIYFGKGVGAKGATSGEICFNTSITGYQEILTDPSYHRQIINFTFPHIGNVGANKNDYESKKIYATGLITNYEITPDSNYRSEDNFENWLITNKTTGICDIDTRALTATIRQKGAQNCIIAYADSLEEIDLNKLAEQLSQVPDMTGLELAKEVSSNTSYKFHEADFDFAANNYTNQNDFKYKVVAIDFGVKKNILRNLAGLNCDVIVVPAQFSADEILKLSPDGVFLSNGPGDPSETAKYAAQTIKKIVDSNIPVFGICLGHQLLGISLGCKTAKLKQGHRGANHPVKNLLTGKVEITSQNHGFAVTRESLGKGVIETHISLFDGTNEGIQLEGKDVFSVQHHPEASPGPKDSHYLFSQFTSIMEKRKKKAA